MRAFVTLISFVFSFALLATPASARYEEYRAYEGRALVLTSAIGHCNMPEKLNADLEKTGVKVEAVACHGSLLVGPDGQPLRVMLEVPELPDKEVTMFFGTGFRAPMAEDANMAPVLAISFPEIPEEIGNKKLMAMVLVQYAEQLHPIVLMDGKAMHAMTLLREKMKVIGSLMAKISDAMPKIIAE